MLNARLDALTDYPFQRLNDLLSGLEPGAEPLLLHVGEPKHAVPALALEVMARSPQGWGKYPPIAGAPVWKSAVSGWLRRRYGLPVGMVPEGAILPVSGSREALYMLGQAVIPERRNGRTPVVGMPNPFYQVYAASALMSGAEIHLLDAGAESGFLPDPAQLTPDVLERVAVITVCSPANPQGAVISREGWKTWIELARRYDFVLAADECYSEIYPDAPPTGVLEACHDLGGSLKNVVVFNSLSKRSSLPGMRCGFVAGDPDIMAAFLRLRSYAAAGMPLPIQEAAAAIWSDEAHVDVNRALYREKIDDAEHILGNRFGFVRPAGGFFLWLDVASIGLNGEDATRRLWAEGGVKVLPGRYLARPRSDGSSIGDGYIRVALVEERLVTAEGMRRIASILQ